MVLTESQLDSSPSQGKGKIMAIPAFSQLEKPGPRRGGPVQGTSRQQTLDPSLTRAENSGLSWVQLVTAAPQGRAGALQVPERPPSCAPPAFPGERARCPEGKRHPEAECRRRLSPPGPNPCSCARPLCASVSSPVHWGVDGPLSLASRAKAARGRAPRASAMAPPRNSPLKQVLPEGKPL